MKEAISTSWDMRCIRYKHGDWWLRSASVLRGFRIILWSISLQGIEFRCLWCSQRSHSPLRRSWDNGCLLDILPEMCHNLGHFRCFVTCMGLAMVVVFAKSTGWGTPPIHIKTWWAFSTYKFQTVRIVVEVTTSKLPKSYSSIFCLVLTARSIYACRLCQLTQVKFIIRLSHVDSRPSFWNAPPYRTLGYLNAWSMNRAWSNRCLQLFPG